MDRFVQTTPRGADWQQAPGRAVSTPWRPKRREVSWAAKHRVLQLIEEDRTKRGVPEGSAMHIEELETIKGCVMSKGETRQLKRIWDQRAQIKLMMSGEDAPNLSGGVSQHGQHGASAKQKCRKRFRTKSAQAKKAAAPSQLRPIAIQKRLKAHEQSEMNVGYSISHICDIASSSAGCE